MSVLNDKLLFKCETIKKKIEILFEDTNNKCEYDSILEYLNNIEYHIDDLQYKEDINSQSTDLSLERIKEYEIEKKIMNDILPYLICLNTFYHSDDKNIISDT
jgi:hypothetical protein